MTFDSSIYSKIGYDELVIYAAVSLSQAGREITFENLVAECFTNFPERFALRGYSHWPDSSVVNKSWLRCRTDKVYLTGKVKEGFRVTPKGIEAAAKVETILSGTRPSRSIRSKLTETRTKEGRLLRAVEQSLAFRTYEKSGELQNINDFDICDMLLCTLESSPSTRSANLGQYRHAASTYKRADLLKFLDLVEDRFKALFRAKRTMSGEI